MRRGQVCFPQRSWSPSLRGGGGSECLRLSGQRPRCARFSAMRQRRPEAAVSAQARGRMVHEVRCMHKAAEGRFRPEAVALSARPGLAQRGTWHPNRLWLPRSTPRRHLRTKPNFALLTSSGAGAVRHEATPPQTNGQRRTIASSVAWLPHGTWPLARCPMAIASCTLFHAYL